MDIRDVAGRYSDYVIEMRRYFHRHPELSKQEYETAKVIRGELDKMGIPWIVCGGETGTLATIEGAKPGRTILLRGDMDALPVVEKTGAEYASEVEGVMHACGHDCHISMLLTAAHILSDMKDELCGTVKLAFQPAEEAAFGAKAMAEEGAAEGVDGCFGMHIWSELPSGTVACPAGPIMAGAHEFKINITGRGGHGAHPELCIDPIVASAAVIENLQHITSREMSPLQPVVVTVGKIESGTRFNIIPDTAYMEGTMRCFDMGLYESLPGIIEERARAAAEANRTKLDYENIELCPPVVNDEEMSAVATGAVAKIMGSDASIQGDLTMGGEDFAWMMKRVPGAMALLGTRNEEKGCVHPQHSDHYCVDEEVLIKGAMLYAQIALDFNAK